MAREERKRRHRRRIIYFMENIPESMTLEFSREILSACDEIKDHFSLKNQFERAGTSIGAYVYEAHYAQSRADFISQMSIALKECHETEYWLKVFEGSGVMDEKRLQSLKEHCSAIHRLLAKSVKTAKENGETAVQEPVSK